jgi:hypothetical protein
LILVLGIWLIFCPMWITSALVLGVTVKDTDWQAGDVLTMVICLGLLVLSTALLYRSTANYRRRKSRPAYDTPN